MPDHRSTVGSGRVDDQGRSSYYLLLTAIDFGFHGKVHADGCEMWGLGLREVTDFGLLIADHCLLPSISISLFILHSSFFISVPPIAICVPVWHFMEH